MTRRSLTPLRFGICWLAAAGLLLAPGFGLARAVAAHEPGLPEVTLDATSLPPVSLRPEAHDAVGVPPVFIRPPEEGSHAVSSAPPPPAAEPVSQTEPAPRTAAASTPVSPAIAQPEVQPAESERRAPSRPVPPQLQPQAGTVPGAPDLGTPMMPSGPSTSVVGTNGEAVLKQEQLVRCKADLESARLLRVTHEAKSAVPLLEKLLTDDKPDAIKQGALLELAYGAQDMNELARAQNIFAQFLSRWPNDSRVPEIQLRLGRNFRQMGLNNLALAKFYAVMTAALALKSDQVDFYQKLVLQAQVEIAETNYQMGKYADAAELFGRLLQQNDPALNRPQTQYRLIRSLAMTGKPAETVQQAEEFLGHYQDAPQQPEVRFLLAQSLKQTGRNSEALQQVLDLLREEKVRTQDRPQAWAYWQQRAGNEIANQLYRDGDYPRALNVYQALADLDPAPSWRLPVTYQIGMTYERLLQPAKAIETYKTILDRQSELGANLSPDLKTVFEMARWRADFLRWQNKAETANNAIANPRPVDVASLATNTAPATIATR